MKSKLEILGEVMMSLKSDQNDLMNDINAILNDRDKQIGLIDKIKGKVSDLADIHASMQETQAFIVQLTSNELKDEGDSESADSPTDKEDK